MKTMKEIVSQNILNLRKQSSMTQIELAKKVNYSDKAISRWENAEVLPDIETLKQVADVFDVKITYLFEEHEDAEKINVEQRNTSNKIATAILAVLFVWTLVTILYVSLNINFKTNYWQTFVWGVPLTCVVVMFLNQKWFKQKLINTIFSSVFVWSLITSIYLHFLSSNLYLLFIVGVPLQACIIVASYIKTNK